MEVCKVKWKCYYVGARRLVSLLRLLWVYPRVCDPLRHDVLEFGGKTPEMSEEMRAEDIQDAGDSNIDGTSGIRTVLMTKNKK